MRTRSPLFYGRTVVEPDNGRIDYVAGGSIQVLDSRGWRDAGRIPLPTGTDGSR